MNTRFFYRLVNGRRNKLKVSKLMNDQGCRLNHEADIAEEDINFYQKQLTQERDSTDFCLLRHRPKMVIGEEMAYWVDTSRGRSEKGCFYSKRR